MKIPSLPKFRLLRWGKLLLLAAPLVTSCAKSSNAQGTQGTESAANTNLVAVNDTGGKDANKEADMKEVILHVFGMT